MTCMHGVTFSLALTLMCSWVLSFERPNLYFSVSRRTSMDAMFRELLEERAAHVRVLGVGEIVCVG